MPTVLQHARRKTFSDGAQGEITVHGGLGRAISYLCTHAMVGNRANDTPTLGVHRRAQTSASHSLSAGARGTSDASTTGRHSFRHVGPPTPECKGVLEERSGRGAGTQKFVPPCPANNKIQTGVFVGHAVRYSMNSVPTTGTSPKNYSRNGSVRWTRHSLDTGSGGYKTWPDKTIPMGSFVFFPRSSLWSGAAIGQVSKRYFRSNRACPTAFLAYSV